MKKASKLSAMSREVVQQVVMGSAWICGLGTGLDGDSS